MTQIKKWLKPLTWLIGLALILWVFRTIPLRDTLALLGRLSLYDILLLILINIIAIVAMTARWWLILRGQGHNIPFHKTVAYRLATFGLSYFTPGPQFGGEVIQVALLERKHNVPRTTALASVALDKTVELLVNFFFLAGGILILLQYGLIRTNGNLSIGFALALLLIPIIYIITTYYGKTPITSTLSLLTNPVKATRFATQRTNSLVVTKNAEREVTHFCQNHPLYFGLGLLSAVIAWLMLIADFWVIYHALGLTLAPLDLITLLTASRIAFLMPTPGALGALEASQLIATQTLGFDPIIGASASLYIRARDIITGLIGMSIIANSQRSIDN